MSGPLMMIVVLTMEYVSILFYYDLMEAVGCWLAELKFVQYSSLIATD